MSNKHAPSATVAPAAVPTPGGFASVQAPAALPVIAPPQAPPPSVAIFGCGGGGINITRAVRDAVDGLADVYYFDTSRANIRAGEPLVVIANGHGSGMVRSANAEEIQKNIAQLSDGDLPVADLNIIVHTAAGGSGSVIAPLLAREIHRRKGLVLLLLIADTTSELGTSNTLNTLKTYQAITAKQELYLPVCLFDNMLAGRHAVDQSAPYLLRALVTALAEPTVEMDRNDRLNWANASRSLGVAPGMRLMHVVVDDDTRDSALPGQLWEFGDNHIFDAVISLGVEGPSGTRFVTTQARSRFRKDGVFINVKLTPMMALISTSDAPITKLVESIQAAQALFQSQSRKPASVIAVKADEVGDNDLVL